jgi:hypothetical protein
MNENSDVNDTVESNITTNNTKLSAIGLSNNYTLQCFSEGGELKWTEGFLNLVVNEGLNDILDKYLKGSSYTAQFYVGLTDGLPTPAAIDTAATHSGWTEVSAYSEANRQPLVLGSVANQSVDSTASKASYAINSTVTIGGAFISTSNEKDGVTGVLYSIGAFAGGDREMINGDTLKVSVTLTSVTV